jgi:hypothetical protein
MRVPALLAAVVVLTALLPARASSADKADERVCRGTQLALSVGNDVPAASGQNPVTVRLTNRGRVSCILNGYPTVSFSDRRGSIPFAVKQGGGHGGDQQVTLRTPRHVLIRPGRTAYVMLNKYRCDLGTLRVADTMRLALPTGATRAVGSVSLRSLGGPRVSYCRHVWTSNVVSVSPFVPSIAAGQRRY